MNPDPLAAATLHGSISISGASNAAYEPAYDPPMSKQDVIDLLQPYRDQIDLLIADVSKLSSDKITLQHDVMALIATLKQYNAVPGDTKDITWT